MKKHQILSYPIFPNLFITSFFPRDNIISYIPGPNLDPVNIIRNGCPIPLKFVLFNFINPFMICSKFSLSKTSNSEIFSLNKCIIFFASSFISSLSFSLKITLSFNMYLELLNISSSVFALFFKNVKELFIVFSLSSLILSLYFSQYSYNFSYNKFSSLFLM